MTDEFLESTLWKNPSLVIKTILNTIAHVNNFPDLYKTSNLLNAELHVGRTHSGLYIGDGLDLFRCNAVIAAIPTSNHSYYKNSLDYPIFFQHRAHLTPFSAFGNEELISILKHFFCSGCRLDLVKSRWTFPKTGVVDECWSLQDVCSKIGLDTCSLCITINL
jgi:hypothetical protein